MSVSQQGQSDYEVTLALEGKAERTGSVMFAFELSLAGLFSIQNVPQEHIHPVLRIEGAQILFPFAREIVATSVRNGGFAPLLLDPVDFAALYQQHVAHSGAERTAPGNA